MEFILFPSDLDPSSGQDVLHGGVIELCKLLVALVVREESLLEGVNGGLLVAKWDGDLLKVKASNIVT